MKEIYTEEGKLTFIFSEFLRLVCYSKPKVKPPAWIEKMSLSVRQPSPIISDDVLLYYHPSMEKLATAIATKCDGQSKVGAY